MIFSQCSLIVEIITCKGYRFTNNKIILDSVTFQQPKKKKVPVQDNLKLFCNGVGMGVSWCLKLVLVSRATLPYLDPPSPRRPEQAVSKHISRAISGYITAISGNGHVVENRSGTKEPAIIL